MTRVVILGGGPGGYTAAFRAADLGLQVTLVERYDRLGGVCLNVGCIPSKALLHIAKVLTDAQDLPGVSFGSPQVDLDGVRAFRDATVDKLTSGLGGLAKQRKVRVVTGEGRLTAANTLTVGDEAIEFDNAILATGSRPVELPGLPLGDPRVMNSTAALALADVPERLLVVGGGIIGLEMATVYDALGSAVTVVELADQLIGGCDPDLIKPLHKRIAERYEAVRTATRLQSLDAHDDGLHVKFDDDSEAVFDRALIAVGRIPNSHDLGLDVVGIEPDARGFVTVDEQLRTSAHHIHAIGDLVGGPMLAHKAMHEAKVAAEVLAGHDVVFDPRGIPSVAYTDPEVAWVGLTETAAAAGDIAYEKASFPWVASGRALGMDDATGTTKLLFDADTKRLLGAGIVGPNAGELIAETGLALELGANVEDIALTIHAHPTLSETVGLAAEIAHGSITDLPNRPRRR